MKIYNSPKHYKGRFGWIPDLIVCHRAEGVNIPQYFMTTERYVSSNFVVGIDGTISQIVDIRNGAWCNGTSKDPDSKVYYGHSTHSLIKQRKTNANYYTVSIEFEGYAKNPLNDKQIEAGAKLIKWIKKEIKRIWNKDFKIDREHIIGHYQINPITRPDCPGKLFPFKKIIKLANEEEATENKEIDELIINLKEELSNMINSKDDEIKDLKTELSKFKKIEAYIRE